MRRLFTTVAVLSLGLGCASSGPIRLPAGTYLAPDGEAVVADAVGVALRTRLRSGAFKQTPPLAYHLSDRGDLHIWGSADDGSYQDAAMSWNWRFDGKKTIRRLPLTGEGEALEYTKQ